ncbi:MAG: hypothetical protein ACYC4H_12770 [Desulfocucumaceae bacterium]
MGYVQHNFFTPIPRVGSIGELNETLLLKCQKHAKDHRVPGTGLTVEEAWQEEKKVLLSLPPKPYDCFRYADHQVPGTEVILPGQGPGKKLRQPVTETAVSCKL